MDYEITYTDVTDDDLTIQDRRRDLVHLLVEHRCEVTFTKLDGSKRVMPCTLKETLVPAKPADVGSKSEEKRQRALDVLSVWCTDKEQWRSFKIDNVKSVTVIKNA